MAGFDSNSKAWLMDEDSEPHLATTTEHKRYPIYSPHEWLLETISSILALGLFIGIAAIFWYMDNKPLSAWRGIISIISLNATVAILTTACTTLLMYGVSNFIGQSKWLHFKNGPRKLADFQTFDDASRGITGSFQLLANVKWNIATIGAFITILRLTFSPFTQQVVLIEQRDVISSADTAIFGYAHNYSRHVRESGNSGPKSLPQDPGIQSAIIQGLYNVNTTEPFSCPGACRWTESYISLGFKAECRNVTQETLQTATCTTHENSLRLCNMTTPAGMGLATCEQFTELSTAYYMNVSSLLVGPHNGIPDTFPEITQFAIYRSSPDYNFGMQDINITDCSLYLTAYEYTGAMANGSDFSVRKQEVDFGVKNPWAIGFESPNMDFKIIYTNETTSGNMHIPAFEVGYDGLAALETFFESTVLVSEWVEGNFENTNFGVSAALSGNVNLSSQFDKMATVMTDYVRYGPNTLTAHGEEIQSEPFVSIRWWYFVVPLVTEGSGILFAIVSIFSNRRSRHVPLWKSSALAVLACKHESGQGILRTIGKDISEIEDRAKRAKARLE